jgi:hypothetical protein
MGTFADTFSASTGTDKPSSLRTWIPPSDVELGNRVIHFSGIADEGRFGLFPL